MVGKTIKKWWPIFVLPTLAAFIIGFLWPFIWGIYLSFCKFTTVQDVTFVGFSNYQKILLDNTFSHAFWLTVIFAFISSILINVLAFVAVLCCLTHVTVLHYISLPILAVMLGGSSNLMVSCTAAIWGRYDFKNAFSVIQPLNSVMTGVGITVVSACNSIDPTCQLAYIIMAVMAVIGLIAMCVLKVEPIDSEVR
mgnify:FL=1